jgi:hypothetical protein
LALGIFWSGSGIILVIHGAALLFDLNDKIVTQKLLTPRHFCNTLFVYREAIMANVLPRAFA